MSRGTSHKKLLAYLEAGKTEAGVDEAGRGCLAGPVFAAAVILSPDFYHPLLNDSKQINASNRTVLRQCIEKEALSWSVAAIDNHVIDRINIVQASIQAMHLAIAQLTIAPETLLIDGNYFRSYQQIPHHCIVRGDARYASIAAASILAKTHRDEFMVGIHREYPAYLWDHNKGYGTKAHRDAINAYGMSPYHRRSFRLTGRQLSFPFPAG